ncbi:hypothetical protein PRZ48_004391 [Zasmidium cellare]|uniref:BHLH domain-containing protein n=1 Tax=Zasmidium cellare TaxID=395010 RepID=A0ABR0EPD7_ZASCE|nr:hypothetical protein PRZ48_004391 [Zasmidium cellare]
MSGSNSPPSPVNAAKARLTDAQKKKHHIESEKKRREAIRLGFDRLCGIVPGIEGMARSEAVVLQSTVQYMREQIAEKERLTNIAVQQGNWEKNNVDNVYRETEKLIREREEAKENKAPPPVRVSPPRFERFENRPVTRSWAKKLSDIDLQADALLALQFKKGNEAIDAFNRQCRRLGLYRKTDDMGSLERAAVDSAMVKGWEEFLWQWEEAGRLQAEEELRRQRQQQQQQRAAQRRAGQPQPRPQKTATRRPRNEPPETNPSASSSPQPGQSSSAHANVGPVPGGQPTSSSPPSGQSSSQHANAGPSAPRGQSPPPANPSPSQSKAAHTGKTGPSGQKAQSQHGPNPPPTPSSSKQTKTGPSAQQGQTPSPPQSKPTQTSPLTQLQRLQQEVLNAQKDLDAKRQAWRAAITPPIRHRLSFINQLDQAQQNAQHALSSAQFQRDIERRKLAAMAMPGSFLDNLENPGMVDESQGEVPEEVQPQESTANPQPAQTKPAPAKPAQTQPAQMEPAQMETKPAQTKPAPAKPAPAKPAPAAPLTELQRHRQRVLDAQKDFDEKRMAYRMAVTFPRTLSNAAIDELIAVRDEAKAKLSKLQFEEDNARRAAAAAAMPGDPKENFTKLGSRPKTEWVIPEEVQRNKVNTGPFSDPQELHQRVVRAHNFLNTCERSYDMNVKPPSRPSLRLVNRLNAELQQARDNLAKARLDEENGRRARAEEAKRVKALQGEIRRKAAEQTTPQTQSSTTNTTPAAPKTSSTTGPSFLAKLTANRLASAELLKKREAEAAAAANPTTYKRRKPLDDDLYLNLMKEKQKGKGGSKAKKEKMPGAFGEEEEEEEEERRYREPTVEEVPDSAREEKMGKGRDGPDLRERIGPSPTVP